MLMKYYSYENFRNDTNSLISNFEKHQFDSIVAIARGGLTLAHVVAEGLDIRDVQSIRTELYDDTKKRDSISIFGECRLENAKKVLILDDISDSGDTLKAVIEHLKSKFEQVEFTSATLFFNKTSIYEPDVWINEADDWIDFFWESDFKRD